MDIEQLVKQAQKNDDHAFYELMQQHKTQLYRIALSYLKNDVDAIDAVQETTYRAYLSLKKLKQPTYFTTWLIRILLNYCHDETSRKSRLIITDELIKHVGISEDSYEFEIIDVINKLDDRYREVITLRYFHDLKIGEIADLLGRAEGTIKTWLYKGLDTLRDQLSDKGGACHDKN